MSLPADSDCWSEASQAATGVRKERFATAGEGGVAGGRRRQQPQPTGRNTYQHHNMAAA